MKNALAQRRQPWESWYTWLGMADSDAGSIAVLVPVFNDWDAVRALLPRWTRCWRALTPLYVKTAAQEASLSCWRVRKSLMTR